jgi:hypothetical protein
MKIFNLLRPGNNLSNVILREMGRVATRRVPQPGQPPLSRIY